ncbi:malonic semialdehyde reductase [Lacimicrobium alkaliphilum]|uniref:Putative NADH dehydrogenase/NAD(P)H nitroreductase GCM10011357_15550 n=1 Tax=Lacimicrobium alkaliphilum TaxID=1526571 RepID=A0ABQ1R9L0_9ALTE|nr:malonic semialdehyde reductase [Lacimicrobium alkaliphilum]GGD61130.1 putative malonic semialdehyde reductase RutE [Lacimicrobium alkaliphilum]
MTAPQISAQQQAQIEQAQQAARELKDQVAPLDGDALDLIIRQARSHNGWLDKPVSDETLRELYNIVRMGSTSMNSCPGRFVFIRSEEAKARLKTCLAPLNVNKVLSAPVTVIVAHDQTFYRQMPKLFAHNPNAAAMFENNAQLAATSAFRNGTLQGAYLMIAARAMGLDVGPMSGFNNQACDEAFFSGTSIKSNFLCSLGYGDTGKLFQRLPRLEFSEACELI